MLINTLVPIFQWYNIDIKLNPERLLLDEKCNTTDNFNSSDIYINILNSQ